MSSTLRVLLWDHLSITISSLDGYVKSKDYILMCETQEDATYVKHHKKKLAFLFSAMRHFAHNLEQQGYKVLYTKLDDVNNAGSYTQEITRFLKTKKISKIIVTHPGEHRAIVIVNNWEQNFGIPVEVREDTRFLCTIDEFADWAKGYKQIRMEYFYRYMRKKYSILMDADDPEGGQWNFDAQNRKIPSKNIRIPPPYFNKADAVTQEVVAMVEKHFPDHFGDLKSFYLGVTRDQALQALEMFVEQRLAKFGDFQDAMLEGEPWMYHSHLSFYMNCGLLLPLECIEAALYAYKKRKLPINAVEGFVRQILGWREYIHCIYWLKMPKYAEQNFLNADRNLPEFYWTGDTKMNCLHQCVKETKENAYAHHIQRLMILGNFALLTGIDPQQVNEWFLIVYADAFEWVELPNVIGMILFADGGYLASKPYAAGGGYINKMSDYCKSCTYKVSKKSGPDSCPFNYLYWNFLIQNSEKLINNNRLRMIYATLKKMDSSTVEKIQNDSKEFLDAIK